MTIKILSKQLASQIAAGEVVERPSSVVKELLENAVDANASEILCEIKGAGKILIRVRDNGSGISKDELPLALYPHATSKISSLEDLEAVETLGFRGEALSSIASVSKFSLTSKPATQEHGFQVSVEGAELNPEVVPAAHPNGTTAEARELFFNTPARRRFLKSDRTETLRIKDVFIRCALAHPNIGFELVSDGKSVLKVKPSSFSDKLDFKRCLKLTGCDFSHGAVNLSRRDKALALDGAMFIPKSEEAAVVEQIFLFLNGRPIADRMVIHAIKEGFFEAMGKNLPFRCVLYLNCDPKEVDVNVHPRKDEVRFHQNLIVHDLIAGTVAEALRAYRSFHDQSLNKDAAYELGFKAELDAELKKEENQRLEDCASAKIDAFPAGFGSFYNRPPEKDGADILGGGKPIERGLNGGRNVPLGSAGSNISAQSAALLLKDHVRQNVKISDSANALELVDLPIPGAALVRSLHRYFLVRVKALELRWEALSYRQSIVENRVLRHELSLPFAIKAPIVLLKALKPALNQASRCGFDLELSKNAVKLITVPDLLKGSNLASIPNTVLSLIAASQTSLSNGSCPMQLAEAVASCIKQRSLTFEEVAEFIKKVPDLNFLLDLKQDCFELKIQLWAEEFLGNG